MTKLKRSSLLAPTADAFVESALKTVGYAKHTCGYLPHAIMQLVLTTVHTYLPDLSNSLTLHLMKKIKTKSLKLNKKFEEQQKLAEKTQ